MDVSIASSLISIHSSESYIGIDEAGRGCLAGPVVAAAVILPPYWAITDIHTYIPGLNDSKKLKATTRAKLASLIRKHALAWGIGMSSALEIDQVNILNATFRAMSRAAVALYCKQAKRDIHVSTNFSLSPLLIDGNKVIPPMQWKSALPNPWRYPFPKPDLLEQSALVDGDAKDFSIAAASILAKTVRDDLMQYLDKKYPSYGFAQHKGYGTKMHIEAIKEKGACEIHRMTFRRVRVEEK